MIELGFVIIEDSVLNRGDNMNDGGVEKFSFTQEPRWIEGIWKSQPEW